MRTTGRQRRAGRVAPALLVLALAWAPIAAGGDLLRCIGPDGKTIYTDNKALCPGAEPFEPEGELQVDESGREGAAASRDPGSSFAERVRRAKQRQAAFEAQEAEARRWKQMKTELETRIEKLVERQAYLEKFITNCNRGGLVFARDEAGIKRTIKCTDIKSEYATVADETDEARAELATLPEKCRRAGCLPGWLR